MSSISIDTRSGDINNGLKDNGSMYKYRTAFYKYMFYADTIKELAELVTKTYPGSAKIIKVGIYSEGKKRYIIKNRYGIRLSTLKDIIPTSRKANELCRFNTYIINGDEYYIMKVTNIKRKGSDKSILCYIAEDKNKNIVLLKQKDIEKCKIIKKVEDQQ